MRAVNLEETVLTVGSEFTALDGTFMSGEYLHCVAGWYYERRREA